MYDSNTTKPLVILLAEDNQDHAELMMDTLESFNLKNKLIYLENGEAVLQYLRREPPYDNTDWQKPDLILLDLKMPRLDGVSTLKEIKSDEALKTVPVVMVSTSSSESEITRCFQLGANSYITKPLQFEEFSRKIRELNLYWVLTSELPEK